MALPILDGNQSATTLSSILTSGEHIPAHTVVSLGTQAITDISGAVSGSVVSISNFPATQPVSIASVTIGNTVTIAGTVTIGQIQGYQHSTVGTNGPYNADVILVGEDIEAGEAGGLVVIPAARGGNVLGGRTSQGDTPICVYGDNGNAVTISGTVTVGNTVTIAGTVTANPTGTQTIAGTVTANISAVYAGEASFTQADNPMMAVGGLLQGFNEIRPITIDLNTGGQIVAGTVTANVGSILGFNEIYLADADNDTRFSSSYPFPISGTVTVGNSVTIASFATSVTARLINPAGTAVTYAEVGTAGSPSIDVLSVQGVTSGTPLTILNHQGTAVTTSDFTSTTDSTVLANYNASREVLTIFNEGAGNLHICAGATCTTIAYQVRLSAGDYYEVPNHQTTITHSAVFATAGTARVTEVS
jgi:hypothetical protein